MLSCDDSVVNAAFTKRDLQRGLLSHSVQRLLQTLLPVATLRLTIENARCFRHRHKPDTEPCNMRQIKTPARSAGARLIVVIHHNRISWAHEPQLICSVTATHNARLKQASVPFPAIGGSCVEFTDTKKNCARRRKYKISTGSTPESVMEVQDPSGSDWEAVYQLSQSVLITESALIQANNNVFDHCRGSPSLSRLDCCRTSRVMTALPQASCADSSMPEWLTQCGVKQTNIRNCAECYSGALCVSSWTRLD